MGDVLFVCEKPVCQWSNALLHSEVKPAIGWKDGTGIYFLNGVKFDEELWRRVVSFKENKNMPFEEILAIPDIDQRIQAMKYGNIWDFVKHAKGKLLDQYTKRRYQDQAPVRYWLYKFPKGEIFTQDAYYMIYDDTMLLSVKQHVQGVEKSATVPEAMAWKRSNEFFTLSPEEWKLSVIGLNQT